MKEAALGRRERRKLKTRNDLKQATEELLIEVGFDALNIQKITDHADLARATFYLHFGDIEEAVWAVLADRIQELGEIMWGVDETDPVKVRFAKWPVGNLNLARWHIFKMTCHQFPQDGPAPDKMCPILFEPVFISSCQFITVQYFQ